MRKNLWRDPINKGKSCIYCHEQETHPAFKKEMLCSSCASDLYEDYRERIREFEKLNANIIKPE